MGRVLRVFEPGDAEELFALCDRNRERLSEFLPWIAYIHTPAETAAFLAGAQQQREAGLGIHCAIVVEGRIAGSAGMHPIDTANRSVAIGYWIDSAHEGQGLVTRAARELVQIAFEEYGLQRVEIRCATHNHRSRAIPVRLGFREEGLLRGAQMVRGVWLDQYVFGKLAADHAQGS